MVRAATHGLTLHANLTTCYGPDEAAGVAIHTEVTAMTGYSLRYSPRHADAVEEADGPIATDPGANSAAREHALALLAASPVYTRVARLLGLDATGPLTAARTEIGLRLGHLPAGWHVLDGAGDATGLDHLIVGPAGVFAVAVQHFPDAEVIVDGDRLNVNGRNQRGIREVRRRVARLERSLSGAKVRPVVAVSGAQRGFAVKRQPRAVTVVNRRTITPFLHAQPATLGADEVERLVALLTRTPPCAERLK